MKLLHQGRHFAGPRLLRRPFWPGKVVGYNRTHATTSSRDSTVGRLKDLLIVHDEVADAVAANRPVVALESTIYTHGALGQDLGLEEIVRAHGAVPAVVGIVDGVPKVGVSPEERVRMVESGTALKASRRDLAYIIGMASLGRKLHAGTTIAGTMLLSRLAGIRVFGTGGLGGVHQGGQDSLDISADLTELGRTRVAVVSSGPKGFLDIARTLEFLETQGVPVSTFADGRTGAVDFPAFWARDSGTKSPLVVDNEREAAAMILAQERLGVETGLLFANPIPRQHAIARQDMESAIKTAVAEASQHGHTGSTNTPYILGRIRELTKGRSVSANVALVRANVERAARVAVEVSRMAAEGWQPAPDSLGAINTPRETQSRRPSDTADILVAGSVALDLNCDVYSSPGRSKQGGSSPQLQTSNPASMRSSIGGVGYNVARAAHLAGGGQLRVKLCSLVGDDIAGTNVLDALRRSGLGTGCVRKIKGSRTAQYVAINDARKDLVIAASDMDIFTRHSFWSEWKSVLAATQARWVVVDANWGESDVCAWAQTAKENACHVAYEPVSVAKSCRLFARGSDLGVFPRAHVDIATPNSLELAAMHQAALENGFFDKASWFDVIDSFGIRGGARDDFVRLTSAGLTDDGVPVQSVQLLPYVPTIITKLGARGVLLTSLLRSQDPRLRDRELAPYILARSRDGSNAGGIYMRLFPAAEVVPDAEIASVNGVGDTLLGVLVAALVRRGKGAVVDEQLVSVAQRAAVMTLRSAESVSPQVQRLGGELGST